VKTILRNVLGALAAPLAYLAALPAIVVALPFLLVGGATRAISSLLDRSATEWHELIRYEPGIGWMPRAGIDTHHRDLDGDVYRVRTDEDGWRRTGGSIAEADVLVVGDSYAYGNAVDDEHFFANTVAEPRIKALGAPGYDMVQELLLLRRYREALEGKLVVWLVYPGNDLPDNHRPHMSRYRAPFVREEGDGWELVTDHVSREEWTFPTRRPNFEVYVEICSPGTLVSRRAFSACAWLLAQGKELCRGAGARLAVVTVPDLSELVQGQIRGVLEENPRAAERYDAGYVDRRIGEICSELGLPFVALADDLTEEDYRRRDVHWNRRGNRRVARVLADLHERLGASGEDGAPADPHDGAVAGRSAVGTS
jgi:hypothetical protein